MRWKVMCRDAAVVLIGRSPVIEPHRAHDWCGSATHLHKTQVPSSLREKLEVPLAAFESESPRSSYSGRGSHQRRLARSIETKLDEVD